MFLIKEGHQSWDWSFVGRFLNLGYMLCFPVVEKLHGLSGIVQEAESP